MFLNSIRQGNCLKQMSVLNIAPCEIVTSKIQPLLTRVSTHLNAVLGILTSARNGLLQGGGGAASKLDDLVGVFLNGVNMFVGDIEQMSNAVIDLVVVFINLTTTPPKTYIDLFIIDPLQKLLGGTYYKAKIIAIVVLVALVIGAVFNLIQFASKGLLVMM